ncbi:MAG: Gfo/Idh/MocA family oxidoreductase [Alphaproteobacteria bacterium]|nr:Gfo/Idh/MocA family oxidoreductase [Alphaproteobacteria bacterium]
MIGGGPGAFIGPVHRMAARLDDRYEFVAGLLSGDPTRAIAGGQALGLDDDRIYTDLAAMMAAERSRADGVDAVAIVTPNRHHYEAAIACLDAGISVICDKLMTTGLSDAQDLVARVARTNLIFAVTYNYTGYPMVRQARAMVVAGEIGALRTVQVEYAQDWLAEPLERTGHKQAAWRADPKLAGPGGAIGDIGTHAFNLAEFVTGARIVELAADLSRFVPGRALDDNAQILLRFAGDARGALWVSQVAPGHANGLRLRVYGSRGALDWQQERPNELRFTRLGRPTEIRARGGPGLASASAGHGGRLPAGHTEGYLEAFATLYADAADAIGARLGWNDPPVNGPLLPSVIEGARGVAFIEAAGASAERNSVWMPIEVTA